MATRKAQEQPRAKRATRRERRAIVEALGEEPDERGAGPSPRKAIKKLREEGKVKKATPANARRQAERKRKRAVATGSTDGKPRRCKGLNMWGEPCGAMPLRPGTEIEGVQVSGDYCIRHDDLVPEDTWKRFVQDRGTEALRKKARQPRPLELVAEAVHRSPGVLLRGHLRTLGLEWDEENLTLRAVEGGGAKVIGFSREGVARVSKHDDLGAWREAEKSLMDRIYGKPKQAMDMGFGDSAAAVVIPTSPERNQGVAKVLIECGALPDPVQNDDE